MQSWKTIPDKLLPVTISLLMLLVLLSAVFTYAELVEEVENKQRVDAIRNELNTRKSRLEQAIYSRVYYTRGLAGVVSYLPGISNERFHTLAAEFVRGDPVIHTMSLARDFVINAIYPPAYGDEVIGLDLAAHPERNEIVEKTLETRRTFIAGPVELVEGGIAFISYTPIFDKTQSEQPVWGMADIVIKMHPLFAEVGLEKHENGLLFALRGVDGAGADGAPFWGATEIFDQEHLSVQVKLPTGNWLLAARPDHGTLAYSASEQLVIQLLYACAVIISILIGVLIRFYLRIRRSEREMKALFQSMRSLVFEIDTHGTYTKVAPTNENRLIRPSSELVGKNIHDLWDRPTAEKLHNAICEAVNKECLISVDYPLNLRDEQYWFHARIYPVSRHAAVFVAHDMTERIRMEERLKDSEQELLQSLRSKDELLSIIAHDLRSPLTSFQQVTEAMSQDFEAFNEAERKRALKGMAKTSGSLVATLDNLLEWARAQTGNLACRPEKQSVRPVVAQAVAILSLTAHEKGIRMEDEIPEDFQCCFDWDMLLGVLRNLMGNSLKFTSTGGRITLSACVRENGESPVAEISVTDNGIGMDHETQAKIFQQGKAATRLGTEQEKGSGLGLTLCRDFVQRQGGTLEVDSREGEGTTVRVLLPLECPENNDTPKTNTVTKTNGAG